MSGFFVRKSGESIEKIVQKSGSLSLLGQGDGVEILIQEIKEGSLSYLEPYGEELLEFYYIIEGEIYCHCEDGETVLKPGDYFYAHNLKAPVEIKPLTDAKLIYVSSRALFKHISHNISVFKEILKKVEVKDAYTHGHGKRVRDVSHAIGKKLGLDSRKLERLAMGALFHDIGKIDIPDEILKKPARLNPEEFELIKKHPVYGYKMVLNTPLEDTSDIIRHHHARVDGSGYPDGIPGELITIESKIIAVADSFDAMTSVRPYREAMTDDEALREIKSLSGTLYDPKVVQALEECLREGLI